MFEDDHDSIDGERSILNSKSYLRSARDAQQAGNDSLAVSLYLAAFDCAQDEEVEDGEEYIEGLKQAWFIAATQKRRTLAEHVFEVLEPYLTHEEVERYAARLQELAMDRLEEFGVSRNDLEEMLDVVPREIAKMQGFGAVDSNEPPQIPPFPLFGLDFAKMFPPIEEMEQMIEEAAASCGCAQSPAHQCHCEHDGGAEDHCEDCCSDQADVEREGAEDAGSNGNAESKNPKSPQINMMAFSNPQNAPFLNQLMQGFNGAMAAFAFPPMGQQRPVSPEEKITYADLAGFERAVEKMQEFGIGVDEDPAFKEFVEMLNQKHGLHGIPICESLLFRSPAREDANHFMEATMGELGVPGIRVHVEEGAQGNLMLCVFAQTRSGLRLNAAKNEIEGSGVLLLEDIDLWGHLLPDDEGCKGCGSGSEASASSKGAKEALRLIRSAVSNPEVYVLASCSSECELDEWTLDLLDPLSVVDIDYPTERERASLWRDLMLEYPSMSGADLETLVAFSKKLPRYDICMAAREAVDASYKASLVSRTYEPISTSLLCEKLAAYQPLESDEYKHLEDQVVEDFRRELEDIDSLLGLGDANTVADLLGEDVDGLESAEPSPE